MRRRLIIIGSALLIVVGGSLAVILSVRQNRTLQNAVYRVTNTTPGGTNATTSSNQNVNRVAPLAPDRTAQLYVARNFTELYGSGSNQNGDSNLVDAQQYGSSSLNAYLNQQIARDRTTPAPAQFLGTVTRALAFDVLKQTASAATIVVSTQQTVTTGANATTVTKDLLIDLVKIGSDWKVNAAVWK